MRAKKYIIPALCALAVLAFAVCAFYSGLTVTFYAVETDRLSAPVRVALITDLHSCFHGENQSELLAALDAGNPDLVLLAGDIADDEMPHDGTIALLRGMQGKYDCYYVTGNHEIWGEQTAKIKAMFRDYGVTVLDGARVSVDVRGQKIDICGTDDPAVGSAEYERQLARAFDDISDAFTILLSHRPERFERLIALPFDLAVSGHAHGGQWRLPLILPGLYAPNQGFFPKYTSGVYELGARTMVVSRGLSRESTRVPRIFNPPELVFIDIVPAK